MLLAAIALLAGVLPLRATFPLVRNFHKAEYGGGSQNWAFAQTPAGSVLVGNQYGMLVFNSVEWHIHGINYGSAVRSILVDSATCRVYVGGSDEFGYFEDDAALKAPRYHSLRSSVNASPATPGEFREFWNILSSGSCKWFVDDFNVLSFDGTTTFHAYHSDKKITTSTIFGEHLWLGHEDGTVTALDAGAFMRRSTMDTQLPAHSRICGFVPLESGVMVVVTALDGLFLYNGVAFESYLPQTSEFLKENCAFCAAGSGDKLAIGTVHNGAVVVDLLSGTQAYVNSKSGLQNNTVLSVAFDNEQNLWLGLDNGLSYAMINSPVRSLFGIESECGSGYASLRRGNELLLGTNQGLFSIPYPIASTPGALHPRKILTGQIWEIDTIGGLTFVCSDAGLFTGSPGSDFRKVSGVPPALSVARLHTRPDMALVCTYYGYYLLHRQDGNWGTPAEIEGFDSISGKAVVDMADNLWIVDWFKGVSKLTLDADRHVFTHHIRYTDEHGFPSPQGNSAQMLDGSVIFSTADGIYGLNGATGRIEPRSDLNPYFRTLPSSHLIPGTDGDLWIVNGNNISVVSNSLAGAFSIDSTTYQTITPKLIPGYEHFDFLSENEVLVSCEEGFFHIVKARTSKKSSGNPVHVSAVYSVEGDTLIYAAELFPPAIPELSVPYSMRALRIDFVMPEYRAPDKVLYSTFIDNGEYARTNTLTSREFTNLNTGTTKFSILSFDTATGTSGERTVNIRVLSPWYRTPQAYILYLLLLILICDLLYVLYIRLSRRAAVAMEKRKDLEIASLKSESLELEIKNKSNELSASTLNLLRKNEILQELSERLSKLDASIADGTDPAKIRQQIARLRQLIRENISHDDDFKTFTRNFDLVYDNYLKRLCEKYPRLSVADQRLCAYIKMGLSSKDIAPLLNITYRSVEMCRYRLRKKMEIPADVTLQDFLANF